MIVFSGDTAFIPEMIDFARGADLLVHEAMYGPASTGWCRRRRTPPACASI